MRSGTPGQFCISSRPEMKFCGQGLIAGKINLDASTTPGKLGDKGPELGQAGHRVRAKCSGNRPCVTNSPTDERGLGCSR